MGFFVDENEILNELTYIKKCREILNYKYINRKPEFILHSFGCQGNVSESEKIRGMLLEMGYVEGESLKSADFVIFNTCAVRESAQNRVIGNLGFLIHHKKHFNKNMIIAICGCMTQQKHVAEKIKKVFPGVDLIFGTHTLHKFARMVYEILKTRKTLSFTENDEGVIAEGLPISRYDKLKAFVPISYGCNNFCSYCIVPYVKGRERSRKFENIVNEVKTLVELGYKDITLLGQNVNSYGFDFNSDDLNFSNLLITLNKIDGDFRIRFLTSHPKNLTTKLIDVIASCNKVCKHIHLPVQSGSDRILKVMNRNYDVKTYLNLVEYAKRKINNLILTTDIIVGFPGETYDDFKQTLKLVEIVEFASIFNFIYSKRVGTKAATMVDLVAKSEKAKWLNELIEFQGNISDKVFRSFVGKTKRVLFENSLKNDCNVIYGRTNENLLVRCKNDGCSLNEFRNVKIVDSNRTFLVGEIVK